MDRLALLPCEGARRPPLPLLDDAGTEGFLGVVQAGARLCLRFEGYRGFPRLVARTAGTLTVSWTRGTRPSWPSAELMAR